MENTLTKRSRISDFVCMLPAFIFALSILLVRLHLFSMPLTDIYWTEATDATTLSDLFNYWKAMAILCAGCLAVIVFVVYYFKDRVSFKKSFLYIPALVYVAFVLVSLAFSDYKYFALHGMQEHLEGTFVLIAYVLMVLFAFNVIDSERRVKMVVFCVLGVALLLGVLGITQATGHDFFATVTGQKMMTPNYVLDTGIKSWDMIDILASQGQKVYDFSFTDGEVYQTVYNINYVPLYLTMLIPLSAVIFLSASKTKTKHRKFLSIISLILYGLFLYNFFAANSASGYFGLLAVFGVALIIFRKHLKSSIKSIICLVLILCLVMGLTTDRWLQEVKDAFGAVIRSTTVFIYADNLPNLQYDYENGPGRVFVPVDFIETYDDFMLFSINGNVIKVMRDNEHSAYIVMDDSGNQLYMRPIENEDGKFEILDDRFHDYVRVSIKRDAESSYFIFTTGWTDWEFKYDGEQFLYHNKAGKFVSLHSVEHWESLQAYRLGTGRGLIWSTTGPMLKSFIVKGAGADCYTFVYPQNDYATRYSRADSSALTLVTDKAHNLYMQYWVNTGLISLIAWLTMVGFYLVGAVKQFRKRDFVDFSDFVNGGIFCGIIGFLFVAFFNDGSVNTMPMFYTMLGTGLAINMRDKWPGEETSTGSVTDNGPSTGSGPVEGKKKGKKAKTAAMPEM